MISPKTCFIIPSVASGGIEMYLLRYLNFIKDTKHITVLVRSHQKGELYGAYKATGVTLTFMPLGYVNPMKARQHYQFYKAQQFDVICDFNANFAGIPMVLAKKLKVPKRIAFYRQGSNHFKSGIIKNTINAFMNLLVYQHATHILSNSQAALEFFFPYRDIDDPRFKVIYNGVNIKDYIFDESKENIRYDLGIPQDAFVIGHSGRLDKAKNHDTILKVFQEVNKEKPNAFLLLCGKDTEQLKPELMDMGLNANTLILGYREDVPRILKSMDCFLFPSITEGQPNALIEAMVAGIPIVASDIPSIRECVPKDFLQNLMDPFDVHGLKNKIIKSSSYIYEKTIQEIYDRYEAQINFEKFKKVLNE